MLQRELDGSTAIVKLARGKGNAMNLELLEAIIAEFNELADHEVRAVVLTSGGPIFSAGVDLPRIASGGRAYLEAFLPALSRFVEVMLRFPKPVVAAVGGHAIAGGCIAALASDYRIMAQGKPTIGLTEMLVGVPFPTLIFELVRQRVAPNFLREIVFTGATYTAEEARYRGLVDEAVDADRLMARSLEIAQQFGKILPEAFRITKDQLCRPIFDRCQQPADEIEPKILDAWSSPEASQAIRGFIEARIKR